MLTNSSLSATSHVFAALALDPFVPTPIAQIDRMHITEHKADKKINQSGKSASIILAKSEVQRQRLKFPYQCKNELVIMFVSKSTRDKRSKRNQRRSKRKLWSQKKLTLNYVVPDAAV